MKTFNKIIDEIGKELDINVIHLSEDWTTILEKDKAIHYITGHKFDLNNAGIASIMDDKGLFYDILKYYQIPTIEQKIIFHNYDREDVLNFFKENNREIIVKGCIGTCGREVYKINEEKELFMKIDYLFQSQYSLSLSSYYDIKNEYRVIILNNEVRLIYGKERPIIVGDGKRTVLELAKDFNASYNLNKYHDIDLNYIPQKDEKYVLNYQFNLSRGARSFLDIDEKIKEELSDLALLVAGKLNITFASIDIIHTMDNKLLILEANSGIMMKNFIQQHPNGYDIAYQIYRDAIKLMFNKK